MKPTNAPEPLTLEAMFQHVERAVEYAIGVDSDSAKEVVEGAPSKFLTMFPDDGLFARRFYKKHMQFFEAGSRYKERLLIKANRVGGTTAGAYEVTCHATGIYPKWWKGRRFTEPVEIWACGTTSETTRNIVQAQLVGSLGIPGLPQNDNGMIPAKLVRHTTRRIHGLQGAIESLWVQHTSGGASIIGLKSYEQGREAFEGTEKSVIWCDEEPDEGCYTEMLYRTVTTNGIVLVTFTPLKGRSKVVNGFLEPETEEARQYKFYVQCGWSDVPHIDEQTKKNIIATTPPYQVKARTEGEPSLGAGAIYPVIESDLRVTDFLVPAHWPRLFALDAATSGYTAAVWLALDREADVLYVISNYKRSQAEIPIHAAAIRARGSWIPGVGDVSAITNADGMSFLQLYRREGLNITLADKSIEAGIQDVWEILSSGRLKVFASCQEWFREYRAYHRDERGKIVKENDHLMDATRMGVRARNRMKTKMEAQPQQGHRLTAFPHMSPGSSRGWSS